MTITNILRTYRRPLRLPINEPQHDKTNKVTVRTAKTQISLGIRPVWSESLLCAQWVAKNASFLHADSEDSDQTGWMPRLIWVFAGRTVILLVLSWGGSNFVSCMNGDTHSNSMNVSFILFIYFFCCTFRIVELIWILRMFAFHSRVSDYIPMSFFFFLSVFSKT